MRVPFRLKEGPSHGPIITARGQDYSLPEISAFILRRARQIAENRLGVAVERAVITVPAHFNELQRASTKVAGRVAAIEVLRMLNEPTAAALAYGIGRAQRERVAVYDFGGGTFDCTLLEMHGNVFEVMATAGDSFLGGDDIDALIAERMADSFLRARKYDPRADAMARETIRRSAEELKCALSTAESHTVYVDSIAPEGTAAAETFAFTMNRGELNELIAPLIDRTLRVAQDALAQARLSAGSLDQVILVGGSTRVPFVRERVEAFFQRAPLCRLNPDEVVALGAAIQAAALTESPRHHALPEPPREPDRAADSRRSFTDAFPSAPPTSPSLPDAVTAASRPSASAMRSEQPRTFGVISEDGSLLSMVAPPPTERASPSATLASTNPGNPPKRDPMGSFIESMPKMQATLVHEAAPRAVSLQGSPRSQEIVSYTGLESEPSISLLSVSPRPAASSALANGPDAQAIDISVHHPVLLDVTPRGLVVETAGGFTNTLIERNAKTPCERTRQFTTTQDAQTSVMIRVAQGEHATFAQNTYLGEVELSALPPRPRGATVVAVTFELDVNGALRVQARDQTSGQQAQALIQLLGVADEASIDAMAKRMAAQSNPAAAPERPGQR